MNSLWLASHDAEAAPGDTTLEIFGAKWENPDSGFFHAFACIEHQLTSGIKEDCYGFYPDKSQARQVHFNSGDTVSSSDGKTWVEASHPFHFVSQPAPCDTLQLYDPTRQLSWKLPIPSGAAFLDQPGRSWFHFWDVTGVDFVTNPIGFIDGPGSVSNEYCKNPLRFSVIAATFKRNITGAQLSQIMSGMATWNSHHYNITDSNCIDFVDSVAAAIGLKRPARSATQIPATYVQGLVSLNP